MRKLNLVILRLLEVEGLAGLYLAGVWPRLVKDYLLLSDKNIRAALVEQVSRAFRIHHLQAAEKVPPELVQALWEVRMLLNTEFATHWTRIDGVCSFLLAVSSNG